LPFSLVFRDKLFNFSYLFYFYPMTMAVQTTPFNRSFMQEEGYNTILGWRINGEPRPGKKLLDKGLAGNKVETAPRSQRRRQSVPVRSDSELSQLPACLAGRPAGWR
jgi:hypothetical protein